KILPLARQDDRFHVGDSAHAVRVAARPMEPEGRTPVMQYQRDVPMKVESLEPGVKIAGVVHEPISANGRWPGAPHAYQVGGEAPSQAAHMRYDIAPKITGGRVAVRRRSGLPRRWTRSSFQCRGHRRGRADADRLGRVLSAGASLRQSIRL